MGARVWSVAFVVAWSAGYIGAELSSGVAHASTMLAWRYLATALVLLLWIRGRGPGVGRRDLAQQAALGLLAHVVVLGGSYSAIALGMSPESAILIAALQPMLAVAVGAWWWSDRFSWQGVLGLVLGILAVSITVGGPGGGTLGGVVLATASMLGLTGAALLERRWQSTLALPTALAVQATFAAGFFTAWAAAAGTLAPVASAEFGLVLVWVVLVGLACYAALGQCLRLLGATATSTWLYLAPPVTAVWAWVMFGRAPEGGQVVGLALAGVAVLLVLRGQRTLSSSRPGAPCAGPPGLADGSPGSRC